MKTMAYKGCTGLFEYDPETDLFHGEVIGISDVITFQAKSIDGLENAFKESVEDYLEFCAQEGKTPEKRCHDNFPTIHNP